MIGQVLALDVSPGQETFLVGSQWDKHWREEIIMAVSESPNRTQGYTKSNSATFLLHQIVTNCDMLHAIFLLFLKSSIQFFQNATSATSLAFQMSMLERLDNVNFSQNQH